MRMRQETFKKSYYIPAFGKSIEIRRNQDIDEEGILGKELLAQYAEDCILEGETKSIMEKVASGALTSDRGIYVIIDSPEDLLVYEGNNTTERLYSLFNSKNKIILNTILDINDILDISNISSIDISGSGGFKYVGSQSILPMITFNESIDNVKITDITLDGNNLVGGGIGCKTNHCIEGINIINIYMKYEDNNTAYAIKVYFFQNRPLQSKISRCSISNIYSDNLGVISEAAGSAKAIYYAIDEKASGSVINCSYNHIHDIYGREGDGIYCAGFDVDNMNNTEVITNNSKNNKTKYYIYNNNIYNVNRRCIKFHSANLYLYNNNLSLYDKDDIKDINGTAVISFGEYYLGATTYHCYIYNNNINSNSNSSNQSIGIGNAENINIYSNTINHFNNIKGAITLKESKNVNIFNNISSSGWFVALQGNAYNVEVSNNKWTPIDIDHGMFPSSSSLFYDGLNIRNNELYIPEGFTYSQGIVQIKYPFNSFLNTKVVNNIVSVPDRGSAGYIIRNYGGVDTDSDFILMNNYTEGSLSSNPINFQSGSYGLESKIINNINYLAKNIEYPSSFSTEILTNSSLFENSTGFTLVGGCTYDNTLNMLHFKEDLSPDLSSSFRQIVSMTEGKKYKLSFYINRLDTIRVDIRVTSSLSISLLTESNVNIGYNTIYFTAPIGADRIYFVRNSSSVSNFYIREISLKEVIS